MLSIDCKESSNLHWARWDPDSQTLEIDFKNSAGSKVSTYAYRGFTAEDWEALTAAGSRGRHFAYVIKPLYDRGGARYGLARKVPA